MRIDYKGIIDRLDEPAFTYCKSLLWPICSFYAYTPEDVRKIDLLDRILRFEEDADKDFIISYSSLVWRNQKTDYLTLFELFFSHFLSCEPSSRAEQYKNRAKKLLREVGQEKKANDKKIEGILMVFLSLFRSLDIGGCLDTASMVSMRKIDDSSFGFQLSDGNLLEKIRTNNNLIPIEIIKKDYRKQFSSKQTLPNFEMKRVQAVKDYFHLGNSVYLSLALQSAGAFLEGEKDG